MDTLLKEAYDNACISGYQEEIDRMTDEEWAVDLKDYNASFESLNLSDIKEAIRSYRSK